MLSSELVAEIKRKKELRGLADAVVLERLNDYTKNNKIDLEKKSAKEIKLIIKEIRSELRLLVGRFQTGTKNKFSLLENNDIETLLKTHTSTAERISLYPQLKHLLTKLKVKSILDIGCGLNPLALASREVEYYASDINSQELEVIDKFFKKKKIKGKTSVLDLQNLKGPLPKTDVCLLFKVLDIIDPTHTLTESILQKIPSDKIIVSFSTRKISGRKMNFPRRFWFEKLLQRMNYSFSTLKTENEFFYIIDKSSSSKK
ncbi:MAG: hypothetical protein KKD18_02180 [Nanoarchaeota archaeon]|nr:hypothetical protein [Nanoarchaeota archaeon]MBU0977199.1 hypothetical protein [Nanoarchaeota archaeon]